MTKPDTITLPGFTLHADRTVSHAARSADGCSPCYSKTKCYSVILFVGQGLKDSMVLY